MTLTWTATGDDGAVGSASSYELRYGSTPITDLPTWNAATAAAGLPVPAAAGTAETFTLTGLLPNTPYFFALRAIDEASNPGPLSNSASRATTVTPPGSFVALTASSTQIDLHWLDLVGDETGYRVERSLDGATFGVLATLPPGTEFFPDPNRAPSTTYYYRVTTLHATGLPGLSPVASALTLPAAGGWRMFARDCRHSAYPNDQTGVPPLVPAWSITPGTPGYPANPAVVENGRVFMTVYTSFASQTRVWARDLATGAPVWDHDFGSVSRLGQVSVFQDRLFVPVLNSSSSFLSAHDAATGGVLWSKPFPAQFPDVWAPTVVGHRVYLNAGTFGGLFAWDTLSGDPLFSNTALDQYDRWSPLYAPDGKIYSYTGSNFRAHHPSTGTTLWTLPVPRTWTGWDMRTSPVSGGGLLYLVSQPDLAAINPATQTIVWTASGFDYTGALAYADGVVFALNDGTLHARDAATGLLLWTFLGDRKLSYPPVVVNNHVYVASDANLYAVHLGTRAQVWTAPVGGWITASDGRLLLARPDGTLAAYTFSAGTRPSEATPPAAPTGLAAVAGPHYRINLSWLAPPTGVIGHRVERSPDGITWTLLTTVGYGTTAASDVGLDPATTVYYRARAYNASGVSAPSNTASATIPAAVTTWSTIGGNVQHTGDNPAETLAPPAGAFWSASVAGAGLPLHSPAMENLRVFSCARYPHRTLVALNEGGTVAWSYDFGANIDLSPPAVHRGRVFVPSRMLAGGDGDPKLFCFDAETGRCLWSGNFRAQSGWTYSPIIVGDTVFINEAFNYGIAAFRTSDGRRLFEDLSVAPAEDNWTPAWQGGVLYTFSAGRFRGHDPATGAALWTTTLPWAGSTSGVGSVATLGATHAYVTSNPDLRAVNLATHANDWTVSGTAGSAAYFGTPAISGGKIFVLKGQPVLGGVLEVRDATGLGLLWSFAGDGALKYPPVVANGYVYISSDANVYAVSLATQAQVWTLNSGGWLALASGRLYIARPDGGLVVRILQ